jgi:Putative MetA-pathway of phenol degradation
LYLRPVVTIFNSQPHLDEDGARNRTTGFGDTVLGVAAARPLFGGRVVLGAGPTFIFPTASQRELGQDTWQVGPDLGVTVLGKSFIAYAFVQQWFKVGGDGRKTNQMNTVFNFTHAFANGWTVGTQPSLSVDWEARDDDGVALRSGRRWERCANADAPRRCSSCSSSTTPFGPAPPVRGGMSSCK